MIFTTSLALLLGAFNVASAIPAQLYGRQSPTITLEGAGPNPPSYTLSPPIDGTNVTISKFSALVVPYCTLMTVFMLSHCSFVL